MKACSYTAESTAFPAGTGVRLDFVNMTSQASSMAVWSIDAFSTLLQAPAKPMNATSGFVVLDSGSYEVNCQPAFGGGDARALGATLTVEESG